MIQTSYIKAFYSSRPGCRPSRHPFQLIHFFSTNFNISSVFGIKDTLLSCNPSGLHSQTLRPGAVEGLGYMPHHWRWTDRLSEEVKLRYEH